MRTLAIAGILLMGACVEVIPPQNVPEVSRTSQGVSQATLQRVADAVMPTAKSHCLARSRGLNCDFQIGLDADPSAPANAFQTVSKDGRPLLIFNVALLADLRNRDELAFIMGHEAAHHIEGHLQDTNRNAQTGAVFGGLLASVLGADAGLVNTATRAGAVVGGRAYSKNFELEADALGARITEISGYNAVRGAAYFTRISDPGNQVLGTHPPNADRIATVQNAVRDL